jgi:hypothetical protein
MPPVGARPPGHPRDVGLRDNSQPSHSFLLQARMCRVGAGRNETGQYPQVHRNSPLVVAKVDRLTRSVAFLSRYLMHARRASALSRAGRCEQYYLVSRLLEAARSPFGDILDDWARRHSRPTRRELAASSMKRPKETLCNQPTCGTRCWAFYLGRRARLRRKLEHRCFLTCKHVGQQRDLPIGKFQRIMMCSRVLLVNLPKDRGHVIEGTRFPTEQAARPTP